MNANPTPMWRSCGAALALCCSFTFASVAEAAIANISPIQDNTVAQELADNSSGACDSIFSGTTDQGVGSARRALMQFDIAGNLPPGAVVNSVTLSMTVTRGSNHVDSTFTLHPINAAGWKEPKVAAYVAVARANPRRVASPGITSPVSVPPAAAR